MTSDNPIRYETLEKTAITLAKANASHWDEYHGTGDEHREYLKALDDVLCMTAIKCSYTPYTPIRSLLNKHKDAP